VLTDDDRLYASLYPTREQYAAAAEQQYAPMTGGDADAAALLYEELFGLPDQRPAPGQVPFTPGAQAGGPRRVAVCSGIAPADGG